jgi:hypothetical protein
MKQLILLCSNMYIETFAHYITTTFQQESGLPGLSVVWQGKTARHEIGLIVIEGQEIPERLQDMIFLARDLFDFTEVFEVPTSSPTFDPAQETLPERKDTTSSS